MFIPSTSEIINQLQINDRIYKEGVKIWLPEIKRNTDFMAIDTHKVEIYL